MGIDSGTTSLLYLILLVGAVVGPLLAGWLSDRFGRQRVLVGYYLVSAAGILAFLAAGSNLVLLVPLLIPFGTAVFSESPVLQAYLADRADGPIRDVAFSVYFTAAFGIGASWAFVIGQIVARWGYPPRSPSWPPRTSSRRCSCAPFPATRGLRPRRLPSPPRSGR